MAGELDILRTWITTVDDRPHVPVARLRPKAFFRYSTCALVFDERTIATGRRMFAFRDQSFVFRRMMMMSRSVAAIAVMGALFVTWPVHAYDPGRIRDILAGAVGGSLCAGPAAGWCAALGMEAAYWVDQGVALVIDRKFKADDQAFANKNGITICYNDGTCIQPKK